MKLKLEGKFLIFGIISREANFTDFSVKIRVDSFVRFYFQFQSKKNICNFFKINLSNLNHRLERNSLLEIIDFDFIFSNLLVVILLSRLPNEDEYIYIYLNFRSEETVES